MNPRLPGLVLCLLGLLASLGVGCGELQRPLTSAIELRLREVYDAEAWLRRVPAELAISLFARAKLEGFVSELELPADVRTRVRARIQARDFVDELVPFLLFLREMYTAPEGRSAETFDDHLRGSFQPGNGIPGMEHSMFRWKKAPENEEAAELPNLDPELVRHLIGFYDVLYLQGEQDSSVSDRLACESRTLESGLEDATARARHAVRGVLQALRTQLAAQADVGAAVDGVLRDDSRLDAATAALIRFVDQTVCRNYRFFAARAFRVQQLERWMRSELDEPNGGELWGFLEHANRQRRYGVAIVVDGLQGSLMNSLAAGEASHPFIRTIAREQAEAGGRAPRARSLRAPKGQQTRFLESLAASGFSHPAYLPFFRELREMERSFWVPIGISTTPTISVRNIPIALTGAPVAGEHATGLPNFHFVDREFTRNSEQRGRAYYFYGSDAVELVQLADQAGMQSLFERLPHLGSLSCTAQYDERSQFGIDALLNLGLGEKLRDFGDRLCAAELEQRSKTERELRELREKLLAKRSMFVSERPWYALWQQIGDDQDKALAQRWIHEIARLEQRTLPELLVYYNPWPDHFAHFAGPFSDEILAPSGELNRLDYWLGRVQRAYREAGVLPRTLFGLAGDHGLAPVFHLLNPEAEVFDPLRAEGVDFKLVKISSDEGEGPKLTNPFDPPTMKGIDVVVASTAGGNYMLDLFRDQDDGFSTQPVAAELRAIRPLANPDAPPIDLLSELTTRLADSLDYLVVRDSSCSPAGGAVLVLGERGGSMASGRIQRRGRRIHYAFEGSDLLATDALSPYEALDAEDREEHARLRTRCLAASEDAPETWCDETLWRRIASYTTRPDSVVQLAHLYDAERAGTINLFPREGVGYNSGVPGRHAGESFHEKNAFLAIWGEPLTRARETGGLRSAVNGAMPMAIYEHLTGDRPETGTDGWGYDPLPAQAYRRRSADASP
ncbi:MAG: alkaline phosphatase family protein [Deltaproteobacteria bacterium]|nr:alkaline phosphatase family protein [Deltaproteobacteria bacterium]